MTEKNRVLCAEFGPGFFQAIVGNDGYDLDFASSFRYAIIRGTVYNQLMIDETTIDLGGYTRQDDLTVFFRNSFEQKAGIYSGEIEYGSGGLPFKPFGHSVSEMMLVSSVPFTDEQLVANLLNAPGFIPNGNYNALVGFDAGNFNRTHIIHGRTTVMGLTPLVGSDPTDGAPGDTAMGTLEIFDESYYSSLEPTSADTLYCYRLLSFPQSFSQNVPTAFTGFNIPSRRVLMNVVVDKEPDLEYMMRLSRSYELANQV